MKALQGLALQFEQGEQRERSEITPDDLPYFALHEGEMEESEHELWVQIVDLSFDETHKWRVSDGDTTYLVSLKDATFQKTLKQVAPSFLCTID